ncbi:MAG: hypothetical protein KME17_01150 [Cyanosarcina radialis HA8281-LM2]|nr:hypothetical protein [Cyanosarcina radialis HA8281-LM2]
MVSLQKSFKSDIDLALSNDGLNLYALENRVGTIAVFGAMRDLQISMA